MARNRSVDFLPEVFKTDINKEFLSSTLDQLTQQPKLKQAQGYIGRKFAPGTDADDAYIVESSTERANYQLEPGIVFKDDDDNVESAITYPELIDALKTKGANVSRHDRLFSSPTYSWKPLIDFDKFVNHSQYYWLPSGPDSVNVSAVDILLTDNFDITRNVSSYGLSGISGVNPSITLARGGEYTFTTSQTGHPFYIQTEPGIAGTLNHSDNISSRNVLGVTNNGEDNGMVTFAVPNVDSQQFYYDLTEINSVDLATFARFDAINGILLSKLGNIDGITDLAGKTIVFLDTTSGNSADLGWQYLNLYETASFESTPFEKTTFIDAQADRYSIYQIELTATNGEEVIKLNKIRSVANHDKFDIGYGATYSNKTFYKNSAGFFQEVPLLSASHNTLYYQDASDENLFGTISLVDSDDGALLHISDIVGKKTYVSPNGVEFTNGLKVIFRGNVTPSEYQNTEYYVEGVGISIELILVSDLITPEVYTTSVLEPFDFYGYDSTNFDGNLNAPTSLDYITINRASKDKNPWSRSNRWVHIDVIEKTAKYNNSIAVHNNDFRAIRPIIEFDANLKLFNFGTESKLPVTTIDFSENDALSNINGTASFSVDGFDMTAGSRVIFAKDTDVDVRNKIYTVQFVDLTGDGNLTVNLVEATDADISVDQCVICTNGLTLQGNVYHYTGTEWIKSQQKTGVNQAPLFDIHDINNISLSNTTVYPASTFAGTKLFSYAVGTGANDTVLGFPMSYLNIDNLGDIVFNNDLYKDTFTHSIPVITEKVSKGYIRKYTSRTTYDNEIGWTNYINEVASEQLFNFKYNGVSLILDVVPKVGLSVPSIKLFDHTGLITSDMYTVTVTDTNTIIKLSTAVAIGTELEVSIISDTKSNASYYGIPKNLEDNPFNENSNTLTLGTIRNHYTHIAHNLLNLAGKVHGANNTRDLGNIEQFGDKIIQNSSPLAPMAKFLHSKSFNFFKAVDFNANAYENFKFKILDYVANNDTYGLVASDILDQALESINAGKGPSSSFYKSNMLAGVSTSTTTNYTVTPITTNTFNIINIYDFTKANSAAILVYLNDSILTKDVDYSVSADSPSITIINDLVQGDKIAIKEFPSTVGSYVPNTPSKLGLYPKFIPQKYADDTYATPVNVIRGHDGSTTVAFNDIRDDVMLEFECRIYNNIKINSTIPVQKSDVVPGKFRTTDYTDVETTNILSTSFLNWIGHNRLDYKTQDYISNNELTWNYSTSSSKLDGTPLKGHWRGVYNHYYDTDTPHLTPWEMLGLSIKPAWWQEAYGPAPYTNGNLVLWGDLETGTIKEPGNVRIDSRYVRTGLTKIIPVDSKGALLNPFDSLVQNYSQSNFKKSWVIGDGAPTEATWKKSSSYPFALQRLFALTKPALYFALGIDRDRYAYDDTLKQYLLDSRYRLDSRSIEVQTIEKPKHSYVNWVADYHNNNGCSCVEIKDEMTKIDIRLCYRMGAFTDKSYLKLLTDQSSTDSANTSLLLPDQSYNLILHKNHPKSELQYSAVIIQQTDNGYSVFGHSSTQQYFEIFQSVRDNSNSVLPTNFTNNVTLVPYGFVFTTTSGVVDFLASYGAFLKEQGLVFETVENNNMLDWGKMSQEFLAWAGQDWGTGSIVNLNPAAISLEFNKELAIVDNINESDMQVLDQNGLPLTSNDYTITRLDNNFKITAINNKSVNFLMIKSTSYEHLLVLDNISIFNDLIYMPVSGLRQQRLRLVGFTTFDWNGQLDAQGFILNQDNVVDWAANEFYSKGNIVKFKNTFWSAVTKLEPAEEFNFNNWTKINYNDISKGLLPNLSNKAGQIIEYYNKKTTNLEADVDLLAMGLTGFRPRSYLSSLDDISQVNFYTEFVASKGTQRSTNAFRNVKFDKKLTDYTIFENWAIREATYGNSGNKTYIELELDNSKLQNNPSIVEVVSNSDNKIATHQLVKVDSIYNQSETHTSSNIFPVRTSKLTDTNLPTAGHVNTKDVDIALFEISDLNGAAGVPFMSTIIAGSTLWVAKDTLYDWNVYRTDIQSNINSIIPVDGIIEITFYHNHDFVVNDTLVIQGISTLIDGAHNVASIVDSKVIRIQGTLANAFVNIASDSSITSDTVLYTADHKLGNAYKLTSVRIPSSDNLSDPYIDLLPIGANVWVDNNSSNKYATYKRGLENWEVLREEQDVVDVTLIDNALMYDKDSKQTVQNLDYIDPLSGKILGQANENIDFIRVNDPASYNQGNNSTGIVWGESHVGNIWWDTSNVRFLDYNQADLNYASKNWGAVFPGSTVDIRQWVKSSQPPSQYKGTGVVVSTDDYTVVSSINSASTITQDYYFWVSDLDSIANNKKLSTNIIQQYITNPKSSGLGFIALLNNSTIAMYNVRKYTNNSVLHISYNHIHSENDVFNEYSLIKENGLNDFLSDTLYIKFQDSLVGGNTLGLAVPDPLLGVAERLGVSYRPRQSMFDNRLAAVKEYLTQVNIILKDNIIANKRDLTLLNKNEAMPGASTGKWDLQLANISELNYQNINLVATGYKYLVTLDTDNNSGWSIYEVVSGPKLQLIQVQQYDTTRAWSYINWYKDTNAELAIPKHVVADSSALSGLSVSNNDYARVSSNSFGKFEIYQSVDGFWERVALEDGTIAFDKSLWDGTSTQDNITIDTNLFNADSIINSADRGTGGVELRNVIKSINRDLLISDLASKRNELLILAFNYVLSTQGNVNWLYKTSLIDVEHAVRELTQYRTYKKDDQDFLLDYLKESKPYHTKIKEFLLKYNGTEQVNASTTDFDVPAYYDNTFNKFVSPVLDYDGVILKTDQSNFDDDGVGLKETNNNIWKTSPWDSWYNNRALSIKSITIVNGGTSYTVAPDVVITGGGTTTHTTATSRINSAGQLVSVDIINSSNSYTTTPVISIVGGHGTGAIVSPVMQNTLVRSLQTDIKYNRCEYNSAVVNWVSTTELKTTVDSDTVLADTNLLTVDSGLYNVGTLVKHNNNVYVLNTSKLFTVSFVVADYTLIDTSTLEYVYDNDNNVYVSPVPDDATAPRYEKTKRLSATDRTVGYYTPTVNEKGLDLAMLIHGTDYPGTEVTGIDFDESATLDTNYESQFTDSYLGTRPADINADGGAFIDRYSSHSPEELVPGSVFDTLDIRVTTRPGFDYSKNGHSFEMQYKIFIYTPATTTFSFAGIVDHLIAIKVINVTTGKVLNETTSYTINWETKTVSITDNAFNGDSIQILAYEIGGGNQLFRETYAGDKVANKLTIPVESQSIYDIVIHINGKKLSTGFTSSSDGAITVDSILETADSITLTVDSVSSIKHNTTTIDFTTTYTSTDFVAITVLGFEEVQHEYSYPIVTTFKPFGADSVLYTADNINISVDSVSTNFDLGDVNLTSTIRQNALVELDGIRLRPPEGKRYHADGATTDFRLPTTGATNHTLVSTSEIVVYVETEKQVLNIDYTISTVIVGVTTYKEVSFITSPATDKHVDVYITSGADYTINGSVVNVKPHITVTGTSDLAVTTWNDSSQLDLLTNIYVGPSTVSTPVVELFDSLGFDIQAFDYASFAVNTQNLFDLGCAVACGNRVSVTRNGYALLADVDYIVSGSGLLIVGEILNVADTIVATSISNSVVPEALTFRIFKDMKGNSSMYRVSNGVYLASALSLSDETIYVNDVSRLTVPNLALGIFGIIVINSERITYREINTVDNTITGLRRGTAGTASSNHSALTVIDDASISNVVVGSIITSDTLGADTNIEASEHDKIWYAPGANTISNGVALQNQVTAQAHFIKVRVK